MTRVEPSKTPKTFKGHRKGQQKKKPLNSLKFKDFSGGEGGIRTLDTLMGYTRFPIVRARPDYATSPRLIVTIHFSIVSLHIIIDNRGKVKRIFFQMRKTLSRADP